MNNRGFCKELIIFIPFSTSEEKGMYAVILHLVPALYSLVVLRLNDIDIC